MNTPINDGLSGFERMQAVIFNPEIPYDLRTLLAVLANMEGKNGCAWPSRKHLCETLNISLSRLKRLVAIARENKLLEVVENAGPSGANKYRVMVESSPAHERAYPARQRADPAHQRTGGRPAGGPGVGSLASPVKDNEKKKLKDHRQEACGILKMVEEPATGMNAWRRVCELCARYSPMYEQPRLKAELSERELAAAKAAGGLCRISDRTTHTETAIRVAFLNAWKAAA